MNKLDFTRCSWCGHDPIYVAYHDNEWGVPNFDDVGLFEFLLLQFEFLLQKRNLKKIFFYRDNYMWLKKLIKKTIKKTFLSSV